MNAVNPFADYHQTPAGVPSEDTFQTAVKTVQKTITLTKPSGLPAGAKWDVFICNLPIDSASTDGGLPGNYFFDNLSASGANTGRQPPGGFDTEGGILMASALESGGVNSPIPWAPNFVGNDVQLRFLSLNDAWAGEGSMRIASFGFEVVDMTPVLHAGGSILMFRQESAGGVEQVSAIRGSTALLETSIVHHYGGYPVSAAECMRIPGSLQWNVTEGAYQVCTFDEHMKEFESATPLSGWTVGARAMGTVAQNVLAAGTDPAVDAGNIVKTHLDMSGSYLQGLHEEAVIVLTMHAVIEIIPRTSSVMIDFVKPGVPASPRLTATYATIKNDIPSAVPKADNDLGDFFKKMTKVMGPVLSTMFPEFSPLIGMADKGINYVADRAHERKAKAKQQAALQSKSQPKNVINNMQVARTKGSRQH